MAKSKINSAEFYRTQCDEDGFLGFLMNQEDKNTVHQLSKRYAEGQIQAQKRQNTIPKIIHQIWLGPNPIPDEYKGYMAQWQAQYPDWEYHLWDDEKIKSLTLKTGELINESDCFGFKSDVLRAEILDQFGGVYVDADYEPISSIESIHNSYDFYGTFRALPLLHIAASHYYPSPMLICNSFIGAIPGHPIIKKYLEYVSTDTTQISLSFQEKYGIARLKFSTQKLLRMKKTLLKTYLPFHNIAMENIVGQDFDNMIYPPSFFNPIDSWAKLQIFVGKFWLKRAKYLLKSGNMRIKKFNTPVADTLAVHHSKATWAK